MICKGCNEEYDSSMFPRCPYCLCENPVEAVAETNVQEDIESVFVEDTLTISDLENENVDNITEANRVFEDVNIVDMPLLSMRSKNILRRNGIFKLSELQNFLLNNTLSSFDKLGKESETEIIAAVIFMQSQENITGFINESNTEYQEIIEERIKIEHVFSENTFNLFVSYCTTHGLIYLDELENFDFQLLTKIRGMGAGKIDAIVGKYESILDNPYSVVQIEKTEMLFEDINSELQEVTIRILSALGISPKTINALIKAGYSQIGQLEKVGRNSFVEAVGKRNIEKFLQIQGKLALSIVDLLESILSADKDDDSYQIFIKRAMGLTLQEIADEKGLTRERIRQIAKKYFVKICPITSQIAKNILIQKSYISVSELLDIYDDDDFDKIIIEACHLNEDLEYLDFADVFVPIRNDGMKTEECILKLAIEFVGDGIDLYENLEELDSLMTDNGYPYIECGEFINLIQKYGYKLYGDYAIKGNQSYGFLCAKIVAKEFPNGIKLYEGEELDKLRALVVKQYGDLGIPENNRSFSSRLADYLVLSGRGSVIAEENISIEFTVVEQIKEYIEASEEANIYYTELFARFEGLLRMTSNVDNYNFLHGVLMLYYPEEYEYSRDCLTKKDGEYSSGMLNERIKNYIEEQNKPVHKDSLKALLPGVSDAMLLRAIYEDKELFQWEHNYYSSSRILKVNQADIDYIYNAILTIMNDNYGYCSDALLYEYTKMNLEKIFLDNHIKSPSNLFYVCTYLFEGEFNFRRPHISKKEMLDAISTKEVALHILGTTDEISYQEYTQISDRLRWSAVTSGMVFSDIEKDYIRVSSDKYIRDGLCVISEEKLLTIEEVVCKQMRHEIMPIINFEDWELLPNVGYEWNCHLLHSIINKMSWHLRIIETRTTDRRYERGIVVHNESDLKDYSEIVAHYLKSNNITEISEAQMLSFLVINGLTYKMIPKELYNANRIKYVDEKFVIL